MPILAVLHDVAREGGGVDQEEYKMHFMQLLC